MGVAPVTSALGGDRKVENSRISRACWSVKPSSKFSKRPGLKNESEEQLRKTLSDTPQEREWGGHAGRQKDWQTEVRSTTLASVQSGRPWKLIEQLRSCCYLGYWWCGGENQASLSCQPLVNIKVSYAIGALAWCPMGHLVDSESSRDIWLTWLWTIIYPDYCAFWHPLITCARLQ